MIAANRIWKWLSHVSQTERPTLQPQTTIAVEKEKLQDFPSLPGIGAFRAVLADQYRKAAESQTNLAVMYLDLPNCSSAERREIAQFLSITRKDIAAFLPSESCITVILPGMGSERAAVLSLEVMDLCRRNLPEAIVRLNIAAYPKNITTLDEFEAAGPW